MPYSDVMMQIQDLLIRRFGQKIEADGLYGPATERAIYNALMDATPAAAADAPPAADVTGTPAEPINVLQNVPHCSQGSPLIRDIKLGMHEGADACRKSGCLSTALWCCLNFQGVDVAVDAFIEHLVSCECYTADSLLIQAKACAEFGFRYQRQISAYAAKNYLKDRIPIIIQIRKPHTHFLVGLGYNVMRGYAVHDPGTREGNFYKDQRWIPSIDVTRYDVALPGASKKAGM